LDGGDQIPILFGARITGNLNDGMRIGVMDVHTKTNGDVNANNFFIASVQQRLLKRSSIKFLSTINQNYPIVKQRLKAIIEQEV
jgi:hypothetical protein